MLSFKDFEQSFNSSQERQRDEDNEAKEAKEELEVKPVETNQTNEKIKKLCRVCSSNGLISIQAKFNGCNLKFRPTGDQRLWQIPISQIIAEISGEEVSSDDSLPQFICEHCLGYLQHAYQLRLKILANSANLRLAKDIAEDDSVYLEESQLNQSRATKREVDEWDEDTNEEGHFLSKFYGANIRINQGPPARRVERPIEQKCPSCKKRVMSIKALNDHMEICEISVLDAFFSQIQSIFSMRFAIKLTTNEFILYAIKLVFDAHQKLKKIVQKNKIDIAAITSEIPTDNDNAAYQHPKTFNSKRDHKSPDNGYLSGGNSNFTPR